MGKDDNDALDFHNCGEVGFRLETCSTAKPVITKHTTTAVSSNH